MSLKDTIKAASEEAKEASSVFSRKGSDDQDKEDADTKAGFAKKSIARAKPARQAQAGVRKVVGGSGGTTKSSKPESELSKDEKKELRRQRRLDQDRRLTVSNILLKQDADYKHGQRLWWIMLGVAIVCILISFAISAAWPNEVSVGLTPAGITMMVTVVIAYAAIIFAFIHDWRKVRPIRRKIEEQVQGYTNRRLDQVLADEASRVAKKEAKKKK